MITQGIITSIDYTTNKCAVRLPLFEGTSSQNKVILEARIAIQPGSFNNYKQNDLVWVGFVDNKINKPLIIGKIYKSSTEEILNSGGTLNVDHLEVTGQSATIPIDTNISGVQNNLSNLKNIIEAVNENTLKLAGSSELINRLISESKRVFIISSFSAANINPVKNNNGNYNLLLPNIKIAYTYSSATEQPGEILVRDLTNTDVFLNMTETEPDVWVKSVSVNENRVELAPYKYLKRAPETGTNVEANVSSIPTDTLNNIRINETVYDLNADINQATYDTLGGVTAENITDEYTGDVRINPAGRLFVKEYELLQANSIALGGIKADLIGTDTGFTEPVKIDSTGKLFVKKQSSEGGQKEIYYGKDEQTGENIAEFWFKEV